MALRVNGYLIDKIKYNGAVITNSTQRLRTCIIDLENETVRYTLEGDETVYTLGISIDETNQSITYTWPDGFECVVTVYGSSGSD